MDNNQGKASEDDRTVVLYPEVADYLYKEFDEWRKREKSRTGREPSQAAFARFLGVKAPSLNQWMSGWRVPDEERKALIAARLGPEIYSITNKQEIIPDDPLLRSMIELFYELDPQQRPGILRFMEDNLSKRRPRIA